MIKVKFGECIDCPPGNNKPLIAKRCPFHYKIYRTQVVADRNKGRGTQVLRSITQYRQISERDEWFVARGAELIGECACCGGLTCKGDPEYEKFSIAHIFPKAYFPSVELHVLNFIEFCFWNNSCHSNYDNQGIVYVLDKPCWPIMVERFHAFEYLLTEKEKGRKFYHTFKQYADAYRDRIREKTENKEQATSGL